MPRSSGNLVDLPPAEKPPGEPFARLFAGEASAQSDLGDSDPKMVTKVYYVSLNDGPTIRR
jgi:hypothetical protein